MATAKSVKAGAQIKADDHNKLVTDVLNLEKTAAKGEKGDTGATGKQGPAGKDGSDAKQIKAGVINEDKNGAVTGATVTFTDDSKVEFTVNKATE